MVSRECEINSFNDWLRNFLVKLVEGKKFICLNAEQELEGLGSTAEFH